MRLKCLVLAAALLAAGCGDKGANQTVPKFPDKKMPTGEHKTGPGMSARPGAPAAPSS